FFFSSRRRHTIFSRDWSSDVCSSDLESPTTADITGHPRAALRRRLVWAVAAVAVVEAVLVVIGLTVTSILLHVAWISALVLLPGALFVAIENYRNLGHGHTGDYPLVRDRVPARRTAALRP